METPFEIKTKVSKAGNIAYPNHEWGLSFAGIKSKMDWGLQNGIITYGEYEFVKEHYKADDYQRWYHAE